MTGRGVTDPEDKMGGSQGSLSPGWTSHGTVSCVPTSFSIPVHRSPASCAPGLRHGTQHFSDKGCRAQTPHGLVPSVMGPSRSLGGNRTHPVLNGTLCPEGHTCQGHRTDRDTTSLPVVTRVFVMEGVPLRWAAWASIFRS